MRVHVTWIGVICVSSLASTAFAAAGVGAAPGAAVAVDAAADTLVDVGAATARAKQKDGRHTLHTDASGTKLQVEVRHGEVVRYVSVDRAGRVREVKPQPASVARAASGAQGTVHKCWAVTQECKNNPLPRSGKPEDCLIEIACPDKRSMSATRAR